MDETVVRSEAPMIRAATAADTAAFSEFGARTFRESFAADNTPEDMQKHLASAWRPELQAAEIADPLLDTLVACDATGAFAGYVQVRHEFAPAGVATEKAVEVMRFYVDAPWHGRGLAQRLMAAAEACARRRGGKELWLGCWERNARGLAFYRKCGFEKVGTQIFVVGDDPQTDHVMLKLLR
jgi:ribosomal protein S18 acetylase RimI-like enzyme